MLINELKSLGPLASHLIEQYKAAQRRRNQRRFVGFAFALMALLIVMSLIGCASPPKPLCEPLPVIPPPALTQPLPSQPYSVNVQQQLASWLKSLTATPATSKP